MNTRRQFLIRAPLGVLVAASACRNAPSPNNSPSTPTTAGAPPTFGTGVGSGPVVTPQTFAEAEKLMQVTMTEAERQQAEVRGIQLHFGSNGSRAGSLNGALDQRVHEQEPYKGEQTHDHHEGDDALPADPLGHRYSPHPLTDW